MGSSRGAVLTRRPISSQTTMIVITLTALVLFFGLFLVFPIGYALVGSFSNWSPLSQSLTPNGFDNYATVFSNPVFYKALWNTLIFTAVVVALRVVLGLALAILLERIGRMQAFFRTVFFLPVIAPMISVALVWVWIFEPSSGIVNQAIIGLGGEPLGWLKSEQWALPVIMIATLWKDVGFAMIFYIAGLSNIPESLYEAAHLDGANAWQRFRYVQLPLLTPQTVLISITGFITYVQVFDQIFMMTDKAGPNNATITLVYFLYDEAFNNFRFGTASVTAFVVFALCFVFAIVQIRMQRRVLG
jgi:multiple sugar transport system permease protein